VEDEMNMQPMSKAFKDEWRRIPHLWKLLKIRINEKVETKNSKLYNFTKKLFFIQLLILQKRVLLFIAMEFGQAKSLKRQN